MDHHDLPGSFFLGCDIKNHIGDSGVILELDAVGLQVLHHWKDQGLVLVIFCELKRRQIRESADVMDETLDIKLHLQSAVPILKGEHGSPVEPEIGSEKFLCEDVVYLFVIQILILCEEELHDLHSGFVAESEFIIRVGILASVLCHTHERVIGVFFIQPVKFVQD